MIIFFLYFLILGYGLKSQDQKDQNDDGLFNRFLIAVAYKHRPNRETMEPSDKTPKLHHLFYLTKILHRNNEEYIYNDEGNFEIIIKVTFLLYFL
jgi:hypothetical protein